MKKWIWMALALPLIFAGCNLFNRDFSQTSGDSDKGVLVLILDGGTIPTKTLAPSLDMDVARYDLEFFLSDGAPIPTYDWQFTEQLVSKVVYSTSRMKAGLWRVKITAWNAGGLVIGAYLGSVDARLDFEIKGGEETILTDVPVVELAGDGNGDLSLTVQWLNAVGMNEGLTATLGGSSITFGETSDPEDVTRIFTYTEDEHAAGYRVLTLQLFDGSTLLWGWMESVRIIADQVTSHTFDLTSGLDGAGAISLGLDPLDNPVDITFNLSEGFSITQGDTTLVPVIATADPADSGSYSYQWYLDGALKSDGTDDAIFYINPADLVAYTEGNHNLSVLVDSGTPLSSETIGFVVVH